MNSFWRKARRSTLLLPWVTLPFLTSSCDLETSSSLELRFPLARPYLDELTQMAIRENCFRSTTLLDSEPCIPLERREHYRKLLQGIHCIQARAWRSEREPVSSIRILCSRMGWMLAGSSNGYEWDARRILRESQDGKVPTENYRRKYLDEQWYLWCDGARCD